jgi:tRNA A-37 threonylcarbamoyl transferase component Bud32
MSKQKNSRNNYVVFHKIRGYFKTDIDSNIKDILIKRPDELFKYAVENLKKSKRARVAIIEVNGIKYFLKRYNVKNILHKFRRICSPSLAWKIWRNNKLFSEKGLTTSSLVAAIDFGKGISYKGSFALYAYIDGADKSIECIKTCYIDILGRGKFLSVLAQLIWEMHSRGIYHGDAKITNFIWVENKGDTKISIIDLDSVRFEKKISEGQRVSDLKNMASSLAWLDDSNSVAEELFDAYIQYHNSWRNRRVFWLKKINKKADKQLAHRKKRRGKKE